MTAGSAAWMIERRAAGQDAAVEDARGDKLDAALRAERQQFIVGGAIEQRVAARDENHIGVAPLNEGDCGLHHVRAPTPTRGASSRAVSTARRASSMCSSGSWRSTTSTASNPSRSRLPVSERRMPSAPKSNTAWSELAHRGIPGSPLPAGTPARPWWRPCTHRAGGRRGPVRAAPPRAPIRRAARYRRSGHRASMRRPPCRPPPAATVKRGRHDRAEAPCAMAPRGRRGCFGSRGGYRQNGGRLAPQPFWAGTPDSRG